jgi:hypothetical protein
MGTMHEIKLELIRPGPSHNQLLSPLTQYTALCGDGEPITFSIDLEQHELMDILARLRYYEQHESDVLGIPESVREATVKEIGRRLEHLFGHLTNLLVEEGRAMGTIINTDRWKKDPLIHLRLISSASELAYLPFEMAISPAASPSEGSKMFVNATLPLVLTREVRRSRPAPLSWNTAGETKVLFIAAQPGFLRVPLEEHLKALSASLEPWVERKDTEEDRLAALKQMLRVLPNASLDDIYHICSKEKFTHVHILAHGGEYLEARENRFGLVLCDHEDKTKKRYVSAGRLAKALRAQSASGSWRSNPQMVSLATCDSGAHGSLLTPGGSIAHELHLAGVPIVIASQFPLTKPGSVQLVRELYPRILRGDDPLRAVFEVRRQMCTLSDRSHDWASLVVYASLPADFDEQVAEYFELQCKAAIETALKFADEKTSENVQEIGNTSDLEKKAENALSQAETYLDLWYARLDEGDDMEHRIRRAEYYGMRGSTYKRIAMLYSDSLDNPKHKGLFKRFLEKAHGSYREGIEQEATQESKFHWVATQALSIRMFLDALSEQRTALAANGKDESIFQRAQKLAEIDSLFGATPELRAWAFATLAELQLLKLMQGPGSGGQENVETARISISESLQNVIELVGKNDFAVQSTARQFNRYVKLWRDDKSRMFLAQIAREAVNQLRA